MRTPQEDLTEGKKKKTVETKHQQKLKTSSPMSSWCVRMITSSPMSSWCVEDDTTDTERTKRTYRKNKPKKRVASCGL